MPHIPKFERDAIVAGELFANSVGQPCWLFADMNLKMYNAEPKWSTIHRLRMISRNPYQYAESMAIISTFCWSFHKEDINVAADLAFLEFYRCVGAVHEDAKIRTNGNAFEGANTPNE